MPAKSKSQARLFRAAEHGATFPKAEAIRADMSLGQMRDFARTPTTGLPTRVKKAAPKGHPHRNLGSYLHAPKGKR